MSAKGRDEDQQGGKDKSTFKNMESDGHKEGFGEKNRKEELKY